MRPGPLEFFKKSLKSDSYYADELINIYFLRPLAAVIVWLVYPTRITPNQLTLAAIVVGCAAAGVYLGNTPTMVALAGLLVTAKDVLDDADGQLARAKQLYSRRGRFLDSIGDVVVDIAVFAAITYVVYQSSPTIMVIVLGILSLLGITLRVSYHVFYQASFLHLEDRYVLNRMIEEVTEEDKRGDPVALRLQILFNLIYTWQDKLMYRIDEWCKGEVVRGENIRPWYSDRAGLRISGLLGFGTEFAVLTLCSLYNKLYLYLWLNVVVMNGVWMGGVLYRKYILAPKLAS
jgi:phosphatidylglycerophosphate synthase